MTARTHSGPIYSFNPYTGEDEIYCALYPDDDKTGKLSFQELPSQVVDEISANFGGFERELKGPIEADFTIDFRSKRFSLTNIKVAEIKGYIQPKVLLNLLNKGILSKTEVLERIDADKLDYWFTKNVRAPKSARVVVKGNILSKGADFGYLATNDKEFRKLSRAKKPIILYTEDFTLETFRTKDNIRGMIVRNGGANSHAAMISRSQLLPTLHVDDFDPSQLALKPVTLDANNGILYYGKQKLTETVSDTRIKEMFLSALAKSSLPILANISNKEDAELAKENHADGIGLLRSEYMFTGSQVLPELQKLLFSDNFDPKGFRKLVAFIKDELVDIISLFQNRIVVVRLLDAPLHEFLPENMTGMEKKYLEEHNPMLGIRGARMLIHDPLITDMMVIALLEALKELGLNNENPQLYLEVPFVFSAKEVVTVKQQIFKLLQSLNFKTVPFKFATMVEIPSIFYDLDNLLPEVDLISIGTNDLTQTFFGISRDDAENFLKTYLKNEVIKYDPYQVLHENLVEFLLERLYEIRARKPGIKISFCGEQASDATSKHLIERLPLDYVSVAAGNILKAGFLYSRK